MYAHKPALISPSLKHSPPLSLSLQMCLRINNVHLLITIFPTLEAHLYNTTRKETHRQVTAFGYISSDIADHMSPLHHHGHDHTSQFGAMRSHVARDLRGTLTTSSEHSLLPRGIYFTVAAIYTEACNRVVCIFACEYI